jgi:Domain of unknown function (DUF4352)
MRLGCGLISRPIVGGSLLTALLSVGLVVLGLPTSPVSADSASVGSASVSSTVPTRSDGGVGTTQTLRGISAGEVLAVSVTKVVDPAEPTDEFSAPAGGHRLVAVQFRIANTGSKEYVDDITSDVQLVDNKGQTYDPTFDEVSAGPAIDEVRIAPGDSRLGYVAFEIPSGVRLATAQFVPDSGLADETGQWRLPAGQAQSSGSPAAVVDQYFAAINAGEYQRAWDLGGKNLGGSFSAFAAGFADTEHDTLTITQTDGNVVHIRLAAEQFDGSVRHYSGTYTVNGGVITEAHVVPR